MLVIMLPLVLGRMRVLLVEDASLMRDSLVALLGSEPGVAVIGEVANSVSAIGLTPVTTPDLAIVDFVSPSGTDTIAAVRERWPSAHVLVLTSLENERLLKAALHSGAGGYVLRSDTRAELMTALHKVAQGHPYVSRAIRERIAAFDAASRTSHAAADGAALLTDREREIMRWVASGLRTREIAQRLSLSHKTVEKHRSNLMRKLGLRSAAAVAAYATAKGYGRG
jgi:two-component system, LuxR family, secretion system response regulator SsrB